MERGMLRTIESVYQDLLQEKNEIPSLQDIIDRTIFEEYLEELEYVADFYLKHGCWANYERVQSEGLTEEDLEIAGVELEFTDEEIEGYLNALSFMYKGRDGKIHNPAQIPLLRW